MYGSLFPFDQWDAARGGLHAWLSPLWPAHLSRSDVVTNLVVYIPFGLFMALAWSRRTSPSMKITLITHSRQEHSHSKEKQQNNQPAHETTHSDTLFIAVGTCSGAVLG